MSLIFPKKEILYAPMLGTLGGGSARGMGRGIGKSFDVGPAHFPNFGENLATSAPFTINASSLQSVIPPSWTFGSVSEIRFDEAGTKAIVATYSSNVTMRYSLSTPWDLTTLVFQSRFDPPSVNMDPNFQLSWDGTHFVYGTRSSLYVKRLNGTPYNLNGGLASVSSGVAVGSNIQGLGWNIDGTLFWTYERDYDILTTYNTSSNPYSINGASPIYYKSPFYPRNNSGLGNAYGVQVSGDGLAIALNDMTDGNLHFWQMTSPYDFSTLTNYRKVNYNTAGLSAGGTSVMGLQITRLNKKNGYLFMADPYSTGYIIRREITFL